MQHPETQHNVTWLDRLRIERAVWSLDQRLYDLPRRTRIETRREVRQNLLTGARDVGTTQALRNLGTELRAGTGLPVGRVRIRATPLLAGSGRLRPSRTAAGDVVLRRRRNRLRERDHRRRPRRDRHIHLGGISRLQSTVHVYVRRRPRDVDRKRFTPLLYVLWIVATILVGRLWRAPRLAETARRRRVICRNRSRRR